MHVHGGLGEKTDYTVRNTVRMADAVDGTILAAALEKTQKRFPYLCVRIRRVVKLEEEKWYDLPEKGIICIDAGCGKGGRLVGMVIEGGKYMLHGVSDL